MNPYAVLADVFVYPAPDTLRRCQLGAQALEPGPAKTALDVFLSSAGALSPGAWEELYTRTWDLEPVTPPYIGFHIWGEDYRRGNFMAEMQRACRAGGVELHGELPDHLAAALGCLAAGCAPQALLEVLGQALEKMTGQMREKDPGNPYLGLLECLSADPGLAISLADETAFAG